MLGPWNTDEPVLLRQPTCDNAPNAELPGMLGWRMQFTPFHAPNSLGLLNLRVKIQADGCPHCDCHSALVPHGYLRGNAATGDDSVTRGLRFFCSPRYSRTGCGRTFSIHWDTVIPYCSLRTFQLFALVLAALTSSSIHGAWAPSRLCMSARSAYRWVAKWKLCTAHVRTRLCLIFPPPGKADKQAAPFTLRHLIAAFPSAPCSIAAFQHQLQVPITG